MGPVLGPQLDELDALFSRFDLPPSGQYGGWYQYFDKRHPHPARRPVKAVQQRPTAATATWPRASRRSGARSTPPAAPTDAAQGTDDPSLWRGDATAERIKFAPGLLPTTMRYTNRPSGIQQVISFDQP